VSKRKEHGYRVNVGKMHFKVVPEHEFEKETFTEGVVLAPAE
jgi:hypothetical protein